MVPWVEDELNPGTQEDVVFRMQANKGDSKETAEVYSSCSLNQEMQHPAEMWCVMVKM